MEEETSFAPVETLGDLNLATFLKSAEHTRLVGIMIPLITSLNENVEISENGINVGRDSSCGMCIPDSSVSRRHAKIHHTKTDEFVIEDLGSSNGTYVDGVPIISCVLRSGDSIQIGRNLFLFDRTRQFVDQSEVSG